MSSIANAGAAIAPIERLEVLREDLTFKQRIKLLEIALNFPERKGLRPEFTATDLDELESILKRHLRK